MFNSLPIEIKLDLLKCLNFDQLFNFRQTNFYFNEFINKNEEILARKEFYSIRIERYWDGREYTPIGDKVIELDFKFGYSLDYKLDEQLIGKWQSSLNQRQHLYFGELISRPQFKDNLVITIHQRTKDKKYFFRYLKLPLCPKNMEEMKIARYFLEQIFRCYFHFIDFGLYIFFPEMIKLLFENDKTTKLKFNGQKATLYYYEQINPLDFALNHLVINELFISFLKYKEAKNEDYNKSLINFLMNEGARFTKIKWDFYKIKGLFYSLIKQIETSTNCLNIVANIEVHASESFDIDLNVRAKNKTKNGEITSFELDNIYNPEVTFLVKHWEREEGKVYQFQIERINE